MASPQQTASAKRLLVENRSNLALPPEWNRMTGVQQWKEKEGTIIIKGKAGPQLQMGNQYKGGVEQWYITNLEDLIKP